MAQPIRLGDLLVRAGVVSEVDLQRALNEQNRWGGRLGTTLVRMGVLTEDLLVKALAKQLDLPRANLDAVNIPAGILARIDRSFCERNHLVPLAVAPSTGRLLVATSDPLASSAPEELGRALGLRHEVYLAGESHIQRTIARLFSSGPVSSSQPPTLSNASTPMTALSGASMPPGASPFSLPPTNTLTGNTTLPPAAANASIPPSGQGPDAAALKLQELNNLARKQTRALQAIVELLIDKGVVTREEYLSWLAQR